MSSNGNDSEQKLKYRDILYNDQQLGPFPMHLLNRVDKPTNDIPGPIERKGPQDSVFGKNAMGVFGKEQQEEFFRMTVRYPIGAALTDMQWHINSIKPKRVKVAPKKAPIPKDPRVIARHIKCLGYFLGADIVNIGRLPQSALYTNHDDGTPIEAPFKYAIVFVNRKQEKTIRASNGWETIVDGASFQTYQRVAIQSEIVANYLRRLGWEAEPSNMNSYLTLMPQILLRAGIGEVSRMGIILNPFLGTNFKSSCVLTNLEMETDGPVDFGLKNYCEHCKICAEQCPAEAITFGEQTLYNGYYTWKLNDKACNDFDVYNKEGCVCGRCTKVCPWTRPSQPEDFANWDGNLKELHKGVNEQRKRLIKNKFVDPMEATDKWWFDLDENKDGELVPYTSVNEHKICKEYPLAKKPV